MEIPNLPAIRALRPAWNKGRIVGQKRPLKPKHVWAIRVRLELAENHRDLASVQHGHRQQVARLRPGQNEGCGRHGNRPDQRTSFRPAEQDQQARSFRNHGRHKGITRTLDGRPTYGRIRVSMAGASIGLEATAYGTHSMRRTKVTQIYKKTGNLRAVQLLLGHTKMDSTVQYLGVELEDALAIAEGNLSRATPHIS